MKLTDFDALSFDCYGTLIDWEQGLRTALEPVRLLGSSPVDAEALLQSYGDAEARIEREHPAMLYPEVIARSAIEAGAMHGIGVSAELAAKVGASVPAWPAFPDSAEALQRLAQRYKLIILSNVDRKSFAGSNKRLGVTFDAILTAEDIGSYKPNPRNFDALLAKIQEMGIGQPKLLHVAQSLFHDHGPAKAAGLNTVWIDRRGAKPGHGATPIPEDVPQPDWTFPSMAAFADAVEGKEAS